MSPSDKSAYDFSFSFQRNNAPVCYHFRHIELFAESYKVFLAHMYLALPIVQNAKPQQLVNLASENYHAASQQSTHRSSSVTSRQTQGQSTHHSSSVTTDTGTEHAPL